MRNRNYDSPFDTGRFSKTQLWMSNELDDSDREALIQACSDLRTVETHTSLLRIGEPAKALHILLDGWAARYKLTWSGGRYIPAVKVSGDICDLDALMFDRLDFGVTTLTPCTIAVMPRAKAQTLIADRPRIGAAILSLAFAESAITAEWAASVARRSAQQRLGHLLCELLIRLKSAGKAEGNSYYLPLNQEQLGDATGLTPVHVNRTLQSLRTDDLITVKGRNATIHDWTALKTMCGFEPSYLHLGKAQDILIPASAIITSRTYAAPY